jgi:hypothetical protein
MSILTIIQWILYIALAVHLGFGVHLLYFERNKKAVLFRERHQRTAAYGQTPGYKSTMPARDVSGLQSRYEEFGKKHIFKPGQLVQWKPGLKNRRLPEYGEAAIVLEVLTKPVYDRNAGAESLYFREPLDILIALLGGDGDLVAYHYDKRRFEPVQDPQTASP